MFHLMFSTPCLYVIVRFIWPLPWPLPARLLAALLLLLASQYHLYARWSSGSVFSPEFARPLLLFFNWAFGAILLLAVLQLLVDVGSLLVMLARRQWLVIPPPLRYGLGTAALLLAALGVQQATRVPPLKDIEVAIPNLPPQFDGYTLLQLTDLHISRLFDQHWAQAVVERANALGVDLIVISGDLVDGPISARRADVEPLRALRAADGVYVIPGNHEYFFDNEAWMQYFVGLGMRRLNNSHALIERGGAQWVLAGVNDLSAPRAGLPGPDLPQALAGAPAGAPVILLDHQPRNARKAARLGVALQLSGHTHGGMIRLLDYVVARSNEGFVSGFYPVEGMQLYVNNGTALWPGFAVRLGVPSELTRITLRRG
ncbi:metallophosphoesterase [Pseudomonas sp. NPDC007930]|uniref:metallophosphoesterase n=1 Tax=Pseudomonas sp. NPDC007930 TaxID=3364417 RepID=UPI0036E72DF2